MAQDTQVRLRIVMTDMVGDDMVYIKRGVSTAELASVVIPLPDGGLIQCLVLILAGVVVVCHNPQIPLLVRPYVFFT